MQTTSVNQVSLCCLYLYMLPMLQLVMLPLPQGHSVGNLTNRSLFYHQYINIAHPWGTHLLLFMSNSNIGVIVDFIGNQHRHIYSIVLMLFYSSSIFHWRILSPDQCVSSVCWGLDCLCLNLGLRWRFWIQYCI